MVAAVHHRFTAFDLQLAAVASPDSALSTKIQDRMSNNVCSHFKCMERMHCLVLKTSIEEITLEKVEARMYKKLVLDESEVTLKLSYLPMVVGCEERSAIFDDEDLIGYLMTLDKQNRRSLLYVEVLNRSAFPEQLSRVANSSVGMNFDELQRHDDEIVEVGPNAITLYVDNGQRKEPVEVIEKEADVDDTLHDNNGMDSSGMGVENVGEPPVIEPSQFVQSWEDGLDVYVGQEFQNKKAVFELIDRGAFVNSFGYDITHSDTTRWMVKCSIPRCKWGLRACVIKNTEMFSIKKYAKLHTCNRAEESISIIRKRRGSAQLVASYLHENYTGKLETPSPKVIIDLIKSTFGFVISYSTAVRGKNQAVRDLCGSPEDIYKLLYRYLFMLAEVNPGTISSVKLDEAGKFKYIFIALGASIEGFQCMRKVIVVDATFLKNAYGGVLVFAIAQDPNRHIYPIAFGVLDGENNESWTWFFERLKTVVDDSSQLVFMSDRNTSLINAIGNVYPQAHHGFCLWHLSQNVKGHAPQVTNRSVVAFRFQECGWAYTVAEFTRLFELFKTRYPSAAKYVEETTVKEKWARCFFPADRYNLDTSNSVESLNKTFLDARKYSLIPMLDTIVQKIFDWSNEHRKEAVSGLNENKLVPLLENFLHDNWAEAKKLKVREVNSYELEYEIVGSDAKLYLVNLIAKTCSCRFFDVQKYPCIHAIAAFITYNKEPTGFDRRRETKLEVHELCSKYYWMELWALAYCKSIYVVPDVSTWIVPDNVKEQQILPPDRKNRKGRNKIRRFPSAGERRKPRTKNTRRLRNLPWLLWGEHRSV